jgi:hypothetical protein
MSAGTAAAAGLAFSPLATAFFRRFLLPNFGRLFSTVAGHRLALCPPTRHGPTCGHERRILGLPRTQFGVCRTVECSGKAGQAHDAGDPSAACCYAFQTSSGHDLEECRQPTGIKRMLPASYMSEAVRKIPVNLSRRPASNLSVAAVVHRWFCTGAARDDVLTVESHTRTAH